MQGKFRFCTLAILVSVCGCAHRMVPPPPPPPGNPHAVALRVLGGPSGYSCMFSGGDKGYGNVSITHSEGAVNIPVSLDAATAPSITIREVYFDPSEDPDHQLSYNVIGNGRGAMIHDRNDGPLDAYYGLRMKDTGTTPETRFTCDPRIVND